MKENDFDAIIVVKKWWWKDTNKCDRKVYKLNEWNIYSHKLLKADIKEGLKQCYGAIWVGNDLKAIAKMDYNGEWHKLDGES